MIIFLHQVNGLYKTGENYVFKKKLLLLYIIFISSVLSCSYCYNISDKSYQTLEDKKNIRLEIYTLDGNIYVTRNFHVDNDTLYLRDYTTALNKTGFKLPVNIIKYIKVCEMDAKRAKKSRLKFAFGFILFCTIVYLLVPKGPIG